ncbi:unnamed protein product [Oppiella nova]|uniref:Nuclear receptor domain-containing protein n=1 Tax=Oppiella nova TaxID=334625 RepID=A0A7R9LCM8_9ACAR|nr:unnamed protein product [Oppiella nova]CAG2161446.1 unnamed protein product [Oppiella nova]
MLFKFVCNFGNDCMIEVNTRRFCIKCRLDKCYAMGMNEAYMLTEEEKSYRKLNGIRNRKWKQKPKVSDNTVDSTTQTKNNQISSLSYTSHTNTGHSTMDIENRVTTQTIVECSSNPLLNSVIPINRPLMDYRNQFNELEGSKLQELLTAKLIYTEIFKPISGQSMGDLTTIHFKELKPQLLERINVD